MIHMRAAFSPPNEVDHSIYSARVIGSVVRGFSFGRISRYAVGWMLAERELATLAQKLVQETISKQAVDPNRLTIHADRGSSMTSSRWRCCLPTSAFMDPSLSSWGFGRDPWTVVSARPP